MSEHREICDRNIGDDGLRLRVWEHCNHKGDMNVSVSRHGMSEGVMTPDELRLLGLAMVAAADSEHQRKRSERNVTGFVIPATNHPAPIGVKTR